MRVKKTKKSKKLRGTNSHSHGARKKWKGSGHRGGIGMAGSGKRADQKKTLVIRKYGNKYFGKSGFVGRGIKIDKRKRINVGDLEDNKSLKKYEKDGVLYLKGYKVLGNGELKSKIKIMAEGFSKTAIEKIKKSGGEIIEDKKIKKVEKIDKKKIVKSENLENEG